MAPATVTLWEVSIPGVVAVCCAGVDGPQPTWLVAGTSVVHETNVRTYVHHRGEPGVYFFSLEAASRLAVRAARMMWGLPYWFAEMTSTREEHRMRYGSRRIDGRANLEVAW